MAAHAVVLAADLERSRLKLVLAREDARRRLGNDLHDGLGHRLAGLLRSTERMVGLVEADPPVARRALEELGQQTRAAIQEVRELAHRLHPPELELFGLVGALREQAERYSSPTTGGLRVSVEVHANMPALPAAVESAAYLIACEALTNVERHSGASQCCVRVTLARRRRTTASNCLELRPCCTSRSSTTGAACTRREPVSACGSRAWQPIDMRPEPIRVLIAGVFTARVRTSAFCW